ncbi:hypothetical protein JL722_9214 [Aureococcus anophagefferens]|nr:hypothetical protein JL722_9214 [Aureococcus anophagefferens]
MRSGRQTVKAAPGRASTRPGPKLKKQQTKAMFQAAASAASKGLRTARAIKNAEGFIHEAHGLGHVDEDAIFEEDEDEEPSPGRRSGAPAHHAPRPPGLGMQGKSLTASSRQFGAAQRSHDAVRATMQMLSKSFKPESLQQSSARDATKEKEQTVIEEKDEDAEQATCAQVKEGKPNLFEALGHISKKRTVKDVDAIKETIHEFDDQLPMLATMSAVQLNAFFRAVTFVEATEGDTIVVKDQRVAALHLIYHGLVKTAGGADGAEERKLAKGAVFGESALVAPDDGDLAKGADAAKERWPENYVAASDCIVLVVKRTDLYPDKKKEPKRAYPSSYSGSVVDRIVQILEYGEPRQRPPELTKDLAGLLNTFDFFKQLPREAARKATAQLASEAVLFSIECNDKFFIVESQESSSRSTANMQLLNQIMGARAANEKPGAGQANYESVRADWLYFIVRGSVRHSDEAGGAPRDYQPGDNLFLSNATKEGGVPSESFRAVERSDIVVVSPSHYRRAVGRVLAQRALIYPIATVLQVLNRPPSLRTPEDTELLFKHCSCVGAGRRGVGGCFGKLTTEQRTSLCGRLVVQHASQGHPICFQDEIGSSFYLLVTGSASVYKRGDDDEAADAERFRSAFVRRSKAKAEEADRAPSPEKSPAKPPASPTRGFGTAAVKMGKMVSAGRGFGATVNGGGRAIGTGAGAGVSYAGAAATAGQRQFGASHRHAKGAGGSGQRRSFDIEFTDSDDDDDDDDDDDYGAATAPSPRPRGGPGAFDDVHSDGLVLNQELSLELLQAPLEKRTDRAARLLFSFLLNFAFFRRVGADVLRILLPGIHLKNYARNNIVYHQGQERDHFYLIISGQVGIFQVMATSSAAADEPSSAAAARASLNKGKGRQPVMVRRKTMDGARQRRGFRVADPNRSLDVAVPECGISSSASCIAIIGPGDTFGGEYLLSTTAFARSHSTVVLTPTAALMRIDRDFILKWNDWHQRQLDARHLAEALNQGLPSPVATPSVRDMLRAEQCRHVLRHKPSTARTEGDIQALVEFFARNHFEEHSEATKRDICRLVWVREIAVGEVIWDELDVDGVYDDYAPDEDEDFYLILQGAVAAYMTSEVSRSCQDEVLKLCTQTRKIALENTETEDGLGRRMGYGQYLCTLVTEVLVLSHTEYAAVFDGRGRGSRAPRQLRPSLLKSRLDQMNKYEARMLAEGRSTEAEPPAGAPVKSGRRDRKKRGNAESTVSLWSGLRMRFYDELLRNLDAFAGMGEDALQRLLPRLTCELYESGDVVVEPGAAPRRVFLVAFGVVDIFHEANAGAAVGELYAGGQFGHEPLLYRKRFSPVGYRARSMVLLVALTEGTYWPHWHCIYDKEEVELCAFLRDMPLLAEMSLGDIVALRTRLQPLTIPRGSAKTEDDVGDDVYVVYSGECQLVLIKRSLTKDGDASKRSPRGVSESRTTAPVAMVGKFYAFSRTGSPTPDPSMDLALLATAQSVVMKCPAAYFRQHQPKLLAEIRASTLLIVDWTYTNVLRRAYAAPRAGSADDAPEDRSPSPTRLPALPAASPREPETRLALADSRRALPALPKLPLASKSDQLDLELLTPAKSVSPRDAVILAPSSSSFGGGISLDEARRRLATFDAHSRRVAARSPRRCPASRVGDSRTSRQTSRQSRGDTRSSSRQVDAAPGASGPSSRSADVRPGDPARAAAAADAGRALFRKPSKFVAPTNDATTVQRLLRQTRKRNMSSIDATRTWHAL